MSICIHIVPMLQFFLTKVRFSLGGVALKYGKKLIAGVTAVVITLGLAFALSGASTANEGTNHTVNSVAQPMSVPSSFSDVPSGSWYEEAAVWCKEQRIFTEDSFSPDSVMTRGAVAEALYRSQGSPDANGTSFPDVPAGSSYEEAVAWTAESSIMSGYTDGRFGADDPVIREQMAAIFWRYAGSPAAVNTEDFADEKEIASYAQEAVDWARNGRVISGKPGNLFDPKGGLTRAQTAVILHRYMTSIQETEPMDGTPVVYMTADISSEGLMAVYRALGVQAEGDQIAVKLSTGEPGSNYLRPELIQNLVQEVSGTIVECNTAYGGSRANTAMHYQVAEDHGYTAIADVDIMDEDGSLTLPVVGGSNLTENYVGAHFANYDYFVILSHFKGHSMAGFGGAIKNISIGIASSQGKSWIHSGGTRTSGWGGSQDAFLESMTEAGKSVVDALDGNILYINVMNRLSVDCDCDGNPAEPDMHDIGILASVDPVALDQACIDLIYAAEDGASLVNRIESRNGLHTLEHAADIGLGSRTYALSTVDIVKTDEKRYGNE